MTKEADIISQSIEALAESLFKNVRFRDHADILVILSKVLNVIPRKKTNVQ